MSQDKKFELTPSVSILIAGVIIAGAIIFTNASPAAEGAQAVQGAPTTQTNVRGPQADDHIYGSPQASIFLIEYSDLQCYYCGQAFPTFKRIVDESNGTIAWIHRHLPLESIHPEAVPSAIASECVASLKGNDAFWQFAETMFANAELMNTAYYTEVASTLGVDKTAFAACMKESAPLTRVSTDANEATQNGANGTPFTVIYSSKEQVAVSGALPYDMFTSVINAFKERQ